ncbi:Conserved_hypothetical protein [Hexamita inflata]|uniref:Uncharacterized protein n=1 Tax=Hexamita inflata TaxID=28002 RepID=A0AA86UHI3_9EUKA|nr:Conserved hypothetical protein [Hexamita inflata]
MIGLVLSLNYYVADLYPLQEAEANGEWYGTESHECVALVKPWIPGKSTKQWKRGAQVKGNYGIEEGTCIASFAYSPSKGYFYDGAIGGHAAVYVSQNSGQETEMISKQRQNTMVEHGLLQPSKNIQVKIIYKMTLKCLQVTD